MRRAWTIGDLVVNFPDTFLLGAPYLSMAGILKKGYAFLNWPT